MNTQLENLISIDANSSRPVRKESHWKKNEFGREMHRQHDKYTPLMCHKKIFIRSVPTQSYLREESEPLFSSESHLGCTRQSIIASASATTTTQTTSYK